MISAVTLGGVVVSVSGQPVSTDQMTNQLAAILLSILGTVTGIHLFIIVATIGCYVSLKHSTYRHLFIILRLTAGF